MAVDAVSRASTLDRFLADHAEELYRLTEALVAFETPCPPGRSTEAIQRYLGEMLKGWGAEVHTAELYPGDVEVVARLRGGAGRSLLINGHVDVAGVAPGEGWTHPPFQPVRRDGRIYGRGACDMKGGIAAALWALRAVLATPGRPRGDVFVHLVTGEEMGE